MVDRTQYRKGVRAPGGKVKDFFFWLRGLWAPKYVPTRSRYGDSKGKMADAALPADESTEHKNRYNDE